MSTTFSLGVSLNHCRVECAGYRGFREVGIFSARNWWKREPENVLGMIKRRHQECC